MVVRPYGVAANPSESQLTAFIPTIPDSHIPPSNRKTRYALDSYLWSHRLIVRPVTPWTFGVSYHTIVSRHYRFCPRISINTMAEDFSSFSRCLHVKWSTPNVTQKKSWYLFISIGLIEDWPWTPWISRVSLTLKCSRIDRREGKRFFSQTFICVYLFSDTII